MWDDLKNDPPITPVPAAQPTGISRTLKRFQLEGLNWMMRQEKTQYKGGLLGDEMGMGKTIQAVSLLMSDYPAGRPSLVVVPPVALMQWQSEIQEYTDGKLKVLVYHNTNTKVKGMRKRDLEKFDVIMISYSGLESIHRKEWKGWNRNDGIVKEDSVIHSIHYHRLILDEAHSIKVYLVHHYWFHDADSNSNVPPELRVPVSHLSPTTSGAFLALLFKIGLGNSSHYCGS
jgi:DNA repair protein RAD16